MGNQWPIVGTDNLLNLAGVRSAQHGEPDVVAITCEELREAASGAREPSIPTTTG